MISFSGIFTNKESTRSRLATAKVAVLLINFKCTIFPSLSVGGQKAHTLIREAFASSKICEIFRFREDNLSRNANKEEFCEINFREFKNFAF